MEADHELRFAYRLGAHLGIIDPEAALEDVPWQVFDRWVKFYELEPFGHPWRDAQTGLVASTIGNLLAEGQPLTPEHFMYGEKSADANDEDWNVDSQLQFMRTAL